jgi:hypothetical protein
MTARGRVSRVSPVQTATRNCTRDEGRPFEVGNQVLISSHRELLSSKAMVVNVAEKSSFETPSLSPRSSQVFSNSVRFFLHHRQCGLDHAKMKDD